MEGNKGGSMTKTELLKMRKGIYLVTDNICNYTYILHKYEYEDLVASIRTTMSGQSSVCFHYDLIKSFDDDYDRHIPYKRMDCHASVGGMSVHKKGYWDVLHELQVVGSYIPHKVTEEINRFRIHHRINLRRL